MASEENTSEAIVFFVLIFKRRSREALLRGKYPSGAWPRNPRNPTAYKKTAAQVYTRAAVVFLLSFRKASPRG